MTFVWGLLENPWMHGIVAGVPLATALMTLAALATWWERRFAGRMQSRYGPRFVGPMGLLQPVADALKLLQKEDVVPRTADKPLYNLAPYLPIFLAMATAAVIPLGGAWTEDGHFEARWLIANLDIGILWVLGLAGLMVLPNWMAGWASNNKYALLSAMRGAAQGISYEIPLVLAALVPVIAAGSFSLSDIVAWQAEHGWIVFWPPGPGIFAFALFFVASLAEANRIPFDIPEAESELVAGVLVEYTGIKFGVFMLSEYLHTLIASALAATLFLGGPAGPFAEYLGPIYLVGKTAALFFLIYWIRWSWYRFRSDQLMELCWKWLVPGSLLVVLAECLIVWTGWV